MPERLEIPVGEQLQRPPAYSAVKVGGRRAYELARAGRGGRDDGTRPVTVYRAELLWHEGDRAEFEIECSAGTYVRTLITDLGDAYCDELERTAIGPFRLEDADPERIVPLGGGARVPAGAGAGRARGGRGAARARRRGARRRDAGRAARAGCTSPRRRASRHRRAAR